MTIKINLKEEYLSKFENFVNSLPKDAIKIQNSLDKEIDKRVEEYKSGKMEVLAYDEGFEKIIENLKNKYDY